MNKITLIKRVYCVGAISTAAIGTGVHVYKVLYTNERYGFVYNLYEFVCGTCVSVVTGVWWPVVVPMFTYEYYNKKNKNKK